MSECSRLGLRKLYVSLFLLCLSLTAEPNARAFAQEGFDPRKRRLVEELVALYNPYMTQRWQQEVLIRYHVLDSNTFTALFDPFNNFRPTLDVYSKMLNDSPSGHVAWVTCHELGHFLGHVPFHQSGYRDGANESAEGEADYFAGHCILDFTRRKGLRSRTLAQQCRQVPEKQDREQCSYAVNLTLEVMGRAYNDHALNPDAAEGLVPVDSVVDFPFGGVLVVNGIDYLHPAPNCRALSAIKGILGKPRPSCWYSPRNKNW